MTDLERRLQRGCETGDVDPSEVADLLGVLADERKRREGIEDELYEERLAHTAAVTRAEQAERERDAARTSADDWKTCAEREIAARALTEADNAALLVQWGIEPTDNPGAALLERLRALEEGLAKLIDELESWGHAEDCGLDEDEPEGRECECGKAPLLKMLSALKVPRE